MPIEPETPDDSELDSTDRLFRRVLWSMPSGLYVIGSKAGNRSNLMTANLVIQISTEPRIVGVSIERHALTHRLIEEGGAFSVCLVGREDRNIIRKFVKPVEANVEGDELNGFGVFTAQTGVPILSSGIGYLDCVLVSQLEAGSHTLFAGRVVGAAFLGEGESALPLRMEDTRMHYGG